jgi:hypothetical protein
VAAMEALDQLPDVEKTSLFGTAVHAVLRSATVDAQQVAAGLSARGHQIRSAGTVSPSLEDVFLDVVEQIEGARR